LLWIKLRQMEGGTLAAITKEMQDQTGDVLERRCAAALGASLPGPDRLPMAAVAACPAVVPAARSTPGWRATPRPTHHPPPRGGAFPWRAASSSTSTPGTRSSGSHDEAALAEAVRQAIAKLAPPRPRNNSLQRWSGDVLASADSPRRRRAVGHRSYNGLVSLKNQTFNAFKQDRRAAQTAARSDSQSRECGEGRDGL